MRRGGYIFLRGARVVLCTKGYPSIFPINLQIDTQNTSDMPNNAQLSIGTGFSCSHSPLLSKGDCS